ncbi:MAG: hypothetical protein ABIO70_16325, partial [Pseudomonadota bacterium]
MGLIGLGSLLVAPLHKAFAPLLWHPNLDAEPHPVQGSKSIVLTWDTKYPTGCEPFRLMIRYDKNTTTPPDGSNTSDGFFLAFEDTDVDELILNLLHAKTTYAYTIYACTSEYGCGTICAANTNSDTASTEQEEWLATSIHGYDEDTDIRILDPSVWISQAGPDVYRFDTGTSYAGQAGIYFLGQSTSSGEPVGVYVVHTDDTTWQNDWNTADWDSPTMIASETTAGDYMGPRNIIVVPTLDDEDHERMTLFVTNADSTQNPTWSILHSVTSLDADGDDFGLCCADTDDCSSTTDCTLGGY